MDIKSFLIFVSVIYGVNVNKFLDYCCEIFFVRLNFFSGVDRQGLDYDMERQRFEL